MPYLKTIPSEKGSRELCHLSALPEDDALREGVEGVDELELCVAAERDHLVHLLQFVGDACEARHELLQPLFAQLLVVLPLLVSHVGDFVELAHALEVQCLLNNKQLKDMTSSVHF